MACAFCLGIRGTRLKRGVIAGTMPMMSTEGPETVSVVLSSLSAHTQKRLHCDRAGLSAAHGKTCCFRYSAHPPL